MRTVAGTVTTALERQFGQIPGLTQMTSSSGNEYAEITLQFDRSRRVDSAAQDVASARLPMLYNTARHRLRGFMFAAEDQR